MIELERTGMLFLYTLYLYSNNNENYYENFIIKPIRIIRIFE